MMLRFGIIICLLILLIVQVVCLMFSFENTFPLVLNIWLCREFIVLIKKMERNCLKLGQDFALLLELGLDMIWKIMIYLIYFIVDYPLSLGHTWIVVLI